ncbi:group 1 glycosyl transferase [Candidatus Magnetoovum chiemensis]|nr:group 1 glycosyl transferase [Candidatus Magnetoovum chiemensis]
MKNEKAKSRKTVLIISAGKKTNWSGIEFYALGLADGLTKAGLRAYLGCPDGSIAQARAKLLFVPTVNLRIRNSGDFLGAFNLMFIILIKKIDVVVANFGRDYWVCAFVSYLLGVKLIVVRHQTNRLKNITNWLIQKAVDRVIAVSAAVKDVLIRSGVDDGKIDILYSGIDRQIYNSNRADKNSIRAKLNISEDAIVVGTAGRLKKEKGVFELLVAFKQLSVKYPLLKLLYVGDGPEQTNLLQTAKALDISERVVFAGYQEDMPSMYCAMDIFVLSSTCAEAFGLVVIEAMAMARPVVATASGGVLEIIANEETGLIVPIKDPQALSFAIERYIKDRKFYERTVDLSLDRINAQFSLDKTAWNFINILDKLK